MLITTRNKKWIFLYQD